MFEGRERLLEALFSGICLEGLKKEKLRKIIIIRKKNIIDSLM